MNVTSRLATRLCLGTTVFCSLSICSASMHGQINDRSAAGVPEDWSHHRLFFSNPGAEEDAIRKGTHDRWLKIANDPRYLYQQWRQRPRPERAKASLDKDWSMNLGTTSALLPNTYPAKFTFNTTSVGSCSDFVVYPTGVAPTAATVIAYTNMYGHTTCSGAALNGAPTVYWAYNTGGTSILSPVLYWDGSKVAYIQTTGTTASLVLLKWANSGGTAASPAAITSSASFPNCTAPCYTTVAFHGNTNDTNSAPFYDYTHDILYVGDNSGNLHKFSPVFSGTPAEVVSATAPVWPVAVGTHTLTGPVLDSGTSGNIFVADSNGLLYAIKASTAVKAWTSSKLTATANTIGIVDSPIVDSTTEEVYVFDGNDANTSTTADCQVATGCAGIFQFGASEYTTDGSATACKATTNAAWATGTNCGVESALGTTIIGNLAMYDGAFDHIYLTGTGTTGHIFSCPEHVPASGFEGPRLNQTAFSGTGSIVSSGVISAAVNAITTLASANTTTAICSPVSEIWGSNGTTNDYIYLSVSNTGAALGTACTGACLYNFIVATGGTATTPGTLSTPSAATAGIATANGTTGIIIDNTSTTTGESQIYYTTMATQSCTNTGIPTTGNCAVQTSQTAP